MNDPRKKEICPDCRGVGASTPVARREAQASCSTCNGHGWRWGDGLAPVPCIEFDLACGREVVCRSCPHVDMLAAPGLTITRADKPAGSTIVRRRLW